MERERFDYVLDAEPRVQTDLAAVDTPFEAAAGRSTAEASSAVPESMPLRAAFHQLWWGLSRTDLEAAGMGSAGESVSFGAAAGSSVAGSGRTLRLGDGGHLQRMGAGSSPGGWSACFHRRQKIRLRYSIADMMSWCPDFTMKSCFLYLV